MVRDLQLQRLITELDREGRELIDEVDVVMDDEVDVVMDDEVDGQSDVEALPASDETAREPDRAPRHREVRHGDERGMDEQRRRGRTKGRSRN